MLFHSYEEMARKGISNVIASLFFLSIVVAFGSIVLFNGITGINAFNLSLVPYQGDTTNANLESILIEHVRFDPNSNNVNIYVRNTGKIAFTINSIKMTKIDTQELIINDGSISQQVQPGTIVSVVENNFNLQTIHSGSTSNTWSDSYYSSSAYNISLVTTRGNNVAINTHPFNT